MLLFLPLGALADDCRKTRHGVLAPVSEVDVEVEFYSSRIVRVKKVPRREDVKWKSYSVVMSPTRVPFDFTVTAGGVTLATDSVKVSLDLQTGRVMFRNVQGALLLAEKDYGAQLTPVVYGSARVAGRAQKVSGDADSGGLQGSGLAILGY